MKSLWMVFLSTSVFASGGRVGMGFMPYEPKLEEVQRHYGPLRSQGSPLFLFIAAPYEGELWGDVHYMGYQGKTHDQQLSLQIHNIGASYVNISNTEPAAVFLGVGGNIIYLRREQETIHNDWLWGLHGQIGGWIKVTSWMAIEGRYLYLWSRHSTLGGLEYDLGCHGFIWSASIVF